MIVAERFTKRRGARTIVSDVTFRSEPGTVTGFLGPNGAGETTTMRMLVGLSEPDAARSHSGCCVRSRRITRAGGGLVTALSRSAAIARETN